jgi:uncharacterized protein YfkK (UPF0435 family)
MDMKQSNIIPFSLRELIKDKDIQGMVSDLYKHRKGTDPVTIFLPLTNDRFNKIASDPDHEGIENFNEIRLTFDESLFLDELFKLRVLVYSEECANEDFSACVKIINPEFIEQIYEWIKDKDLIINYGIFSLHTFTGEAYCLDSKYIFHTNKGLFRVFQAFLKEPTHILAYKKIYNIFQDSDKLTSGSETIHQIIGEIREKLQMKGKLSKLFIPSSDSYILKSS